MLQARDRFSRGNKVIARTPRGLEYGEVLGEATPQALEHMKDPPAGTIQRLATTQDDNELARIIAMSKEEFAKCKNKIIESNLPMDLVDIEHLFGGERVVVYYISEDRIDFRDLVKQLATEFQTRIEMKQIGVRDEAKLLADYGDCGKVVCCNTHLLQMPPVSMKMAKMQKATLDPNKISGRCGRLKCCLRYEFDIYEENYRALPPIGSDVVTNQGRARVLGHELLAKQVLVQMEDDRRIVLQADDILTVLKGNRRSQVEDSESTDGPVAAVVEEQQNQSRGESSPGSNRAENGDRGRRNSPGHDAADRDRGRQPRPEQSRPDSDRRGSNERPRPKKGFGEGLDLESSDQITPPPVDEPPNNPIQENVRESDEKGIEPNES